VLFVMTGADHAPAGRHAFFDNAALSASQGNLLVLIWISTLVIAVTTAARQIPGNGRAHHFSIAAKPVRRWELVAASSGVLAGLCHHPGWFYLFFGIINRPRERPGGMIFFQAVWLPRGFFGRVVALVCWGRWSSPPSLQCDHLPHRLVGILYAAVS